MVKKGKRGTNCIRIHFLLHGRVRLALNTCRESKLPLQMLQPQSRVLGLQACSTVLTQKWHLKIPQGTLTKGPRRLYYDVTTSYLPNKDKDSLLSWKQASTIVTSEQTVTFPKLHINHIPGQF